MKIIRIHRLLDSFVNHSFVNRARQTPDYMTKTKRGQDVTRRKDIRARYGIKAASSVLGYAALEVTQILAEQDRKRSVTVAAETG